LAHQVAIPVGATNGSGPGGAGEQTAVGRAADKPVPADPGREDRREDAPVDEEGAEHLAALRELPEQQAPHIGRAVPELVFQLLQMPRAPGDGLAHLRDLRLEGDATRLLGAECVEHRLRCGF